MKTIALIAILILNLLPAYSQSKISKLAYSLVDTTTCETEQAKALYHWITHTIAYDTRQLKKGIKHYTPLQTLQRKKGVCYGYAELFYQMCQALGVECYIVNGNCKGAGYVKGQHFTKSDHAWNVIYADSTWMLVDATWGSGSIRYAYDFKSSVVRTFNKNRGIKTKVIFHRAPTDKYFAIAPDSLCLTHFPNDAKWQLKHYPISYNQFRSDTIHPSQYLDYEREIAQIRLHGLDAQLFTDAKNSVVYNPFNKFDIAGGYYNQAGRVGINRKTPLDSTLLTSVLLAGSYCDTTLKYLAAYKQIRRSLYKTKRLVNRPVYKHALNSMKKVKKVPTTFNDRYYKAYGKLLRNDMVLDKARLSTFNSSIAIVGDVVYEYDTVSTTDTIAYTGYLLRIHSDSAQVQEALLELDGLSGQIELAYNSGHGMNDSIGRYLEAVSVAIQAIGISVTLLDEYEFIQACKHLKTAHEWYLHHYQLKRQVEEQLTADLYAFHHTYQGIEKRLFTMLGSYERLAKLSGENNKYSREANATLTVLRNLYATKMDAIHFLKQHNDSWKRLLSNQNELLSIYGGKGLSNTSNMMAEYYNHISDQWDKYYLADMKTYDQIRTDAKKKKTLFKNTVKVIE